MVTDLNVMVHFHGRTRPSFSKTMVTDLNVMVHFHGRTRPLPNTVPERKKNVIILRCKTIANNNEVAFNQITYDIK